MQITHAITVREPFGWLITNGFKLSEVRSKPFPSNHPMPCWVAIHASVSHEQMADENLIYDIAESHQEIWDAWDDKEIGRVTGVSEIIGAARIVMSIPGSDYTKEQMATLDDVWAARSERCTIDGFDPVETLEDEGHNWIIDDVYRFENRIVCPGNLNVWSLQPALKPIVNQQFQKAIKSGGLGRRQAVGKPIIYQLPKMPSARMAKLGWVKAMPKARKVIV